MAGQAQQGVLPRYDDEAVVMMRGRELNQIADMLERQRLVAGEGVELEEGPSGVVVNALGGGALADGTCPLGGLDESGDIYPGYVIGGGKSELIEPGSITPANGKNVWIKCTWTADEVDEVLQAGGSRGNVTVHSGSTVPADDVPTIDDLTGIVYYVLVGWDSNGGLVSSGCGTVNIGFCPGGFTKWRT